jgi:hypothetical protein
MVVWVILFFLLIALTVVIIWTGKADDSHYKSPYSSYWNRESVKEDEDDSSKYQGNDAPKQKLKSNAGDASSVLITSTSDSASSCDGSSGSSSGGDCGGGSS